MRFLIAATLLVSGCASPERPPRAEDIWAQLHAAVGRGPGTVIDLDSVAPGPWRRVYVFGPCTTVSQIADCLHITSAEHLSLGIEDRDDANLLIFEDSAQRYRSVDVPRGGADFGPSAVGTGYAIGEARFRVQTPPPRSWGDLVPMEASEIVCDSSAGGARP